jgi:hypothetical protein
MYKWHVPFSGLHLRESPSMGCSWNKDGLPVFISLLLMSGLKWFENNATLTSSNCIRDFINETERYCILTTVPAAKIIQRLWWMNEALSMEHWWNDSERGKQKQPALRKSLHQCHAIPITNPTTWIGLGLNSFSWQLKSTSWLWQRSLKTRWDPNKNGHFMNVTLYFDVSNVHCL